MKIVAALRTPRAGAVEMPPRGKRGKLPERVSHPFHRAWKSGTRTAGFPHFHRADGGLVYEKGDKKR